MVIISKEEESFIEYKTKSKSLCNKDFVSKKDSHIKIKTIPKYFHLIFITYIILLLINSISCESYIILKINKKGNFKILYDGNNEDNSIHKCKGNNKHIPDSVTVNNISVSPPQSGIYEFTEDENTIKLYYPEDKNSFRCLFYGCTDIDEIDTSHLVTSNVEKIDFMFYKCNNLKSLNISNLNTEKVRSMEYLFGFCNSLTSIDVSNFNTSLVNKFSHFFEGCSNLAEVNVLNFDTSNALAIDSFFKRCTSLKSINISNFITSKVIWMADMFFECTSLTSLNLSNFNTSSVEQFYGMFRNCQSLTSLNLLNFDTKSALRLDSMFWDCNNLKYLDIQSFDTSTVNRIDNMFRNCYSLVSLDITNFNTQKVEQMQYMFNECRSLISLDLSSFDTSLVTQFNYTFSGCESLKSLNISNFNTSRVNNMENMFYKCKSLSYLDLSHFDFSKVNNLKYMFSGCNNLKYIDLKNLIIKDNTQYEGIIDNTLINPIICLDDEESQSKIISLFQGHYSNDSDNFGNNCYQMCSYFFYFNENKYICTEKYECPKIYNKLIYDKNECIKSCNESSEYMYEIKLEFGNQCIMDCPENLQVTNENYCTKECLKDSPFMLIDSLNCVSTCTIEQRQNKFCMTNYNTKNQESNEVIDTVINQIRDQLINNFDESIVGEKQINENGVNISINKLNNENMDDNDINLGECEDRLKKHYNISETESLYMLRIDVEQKGLQVSALEYEILYPINGSRNLVKLDLSICHDIKINRVISINITDDIEKYIKNGPYYNDICYIIDSDDEVDITLTDRRENYINNNMGICEDGCDFASYNYETKKAVCSCNIKTEIPLMNEAKLDKKALLKSFIDINNIANIQMLKCYKVVFQKNNILKNIGCFIYASLILFNFICFLYFIIKDYKRLLKIVKKIKNKIMKKEIDNNEKIPYKISKKKKMKENIYNIKSSDRKFDLKRKTLKMEKNKKKMHSPPKINFNKISINNISIKNKDKRKSFTKEKSINNYNKSNKGFIFNDKNNKLDNHKDKLIKLNYNEINHLTFDDAIIKDKRTFFQYYLSLLKSNHLLLFIFYSKDYNSKSIKTSIFIWNIASSIAINSLFFNDSTMHKIYIEHGTFDFLYQLPQIIYSTIISIILDFLINLLGLSEQNILEIKNENKSTQDMNKKFNKLLKILKIKFTLYFIINILLLFSFWYYVTCFCGIYRNTQIHLLKDSLFSYITSLISPFCIYLFPGLFRIWALKRKSKILYVFSQILQEF